MRTRELFLQGCLFTISSLTSLFLLSIVVHFPLGRVLFAVLVSGICLIAECFALFKVAQLLVAVERQSCSRHCAHFPASPIVLRSFDRDQELKHI